MARLHEVELPVTLTALHQLFMVPLVGDAPILQVNYLIAETIGIQPVGDEHGGLSLGHLAETLDRKSVV